MKEVIITIIGEQFVSLFNKDSIEFVTSGSLAALEDDSYNLFYEERTVYGQNSTTVMTIEPSRLIINRNGDAASQMIFDPYKKNLCHYDTGYGIFELGISTKNFNRSFSIAGGDVSLNYTLEINNFIASENKIHINVREAENARDIKS